MRPSLPPYCCSFTLKSGETEDGIIGLYVAQEFTGETADRLRNDSHWGVPKSSIWMERRRVAMHFRDVFGLPWFLKMHLDMSPRFYNTSDIFVNSVYYCVFVMWRMQLEAFLSKASRSFEDLWMWIQGNSVMFFPMLVRPFQRWANGLPLICLQCLRQCRKTKCAFGWVSKQRLEWEI